MSSDRQRCPNCGFDVFLTGSECALCGHQHPDVAASDGEPAP